MGDKDTQEQLILHWMENGNPITQREAARHFGCFRLGARIFDLRAKGHDIETVMVTRHNANGSTTNYARYFLKGHTRRT